MLFFALRSLPSGVFGPVLFWALARLILDRSSDESMSPPVSQFELEVEEAAGRGLVG